MVSSKAAPPTFSHAEFEAIPHTVQRKYFSSLERLRIAEEHSLRQQEQERAISDSRRPSYASSTLHRSLTLGARRRLRKAVSVQKELDISQSEIQFFLSLPEKVRKQHFSREEQVLLLGRYEQGTCHPEDLQVDRAKQRFDDFHFDFIDDSSSVPSRGRSRRRSSSVSPHQSLSPDLGQELGSDRSIKSTERSFPLFLDSMSPPASQQAVPNTPFRRTLSLTSMSFRHSTSSAPLSPPLFSLGPQPWRPRASSSSQQSQSGRRSSHTPVAPVFDPEATHYQDPEARKKLRMFLASPQKFDEAVEFGFPSAAGDDTVTPRYQLPPIATDARNFSRDMQTFLKDDRISFLEETEDEDVAPSSDDESVEEESPITPSSVGLSFRGHTRYASPSNFSSLDSTGLPPLHAGIGRGLNREMTLRMTLTRPDLRADEDQLYGWQGQRGSRDDPFALEELHFSDDTTGAKGAFAVKPKQGNLVTRLFKRANKKGR
ncbi:hypothetical protein BDV96DRAFT_502609 [Lophiotrema nucula]|uniref:Uncharacterized protein n=1 Tax=Lophiotrema nucula TaxID=690887 RepID=A0A6A5YS47_9PLEO|nr:hypothetical protein BDV96DRAFT_502609 [Lophiotrema nucula]